MHVERMKTIQTILALMSAPALCLTAMAAEKQLGALEGYLPVGKLLQGRAVRPVTDEALAPILQKVDEKFQKLSEEERKKMLEKRNMERALDYEKALWSTKAEYNEYLKIWANTKMQEREAVAIGLREIEGQPNMWGVVSATMDPQGKTLPLTVSALTYDANKNVWISNNGELAMKAVDEDSKYLYGAQKGNKWTLEKEDAIVKMIENLQITKTKDDKYIFVSYSFVEASKASGQLIAQGGYVLRFPNVSAGVNVTKPGQR